MRTENISVYVIDLCVENRFVTEIFYFCIAYIYSWYIYHYTLDYDFFLTLQTYLLSHHQVLLELHFTFMQFKEIIVCPLCFPIIILFLQWNGIFRENDNRKHWNNFGYFKYLCLDFGFTQKFFVGSMNLLIG